MKVFDSFSLAYRTIRGNKLRTGLTVAIIALGIAALVGIRTAIEAMTQKFTESFSAMGANGYSIRYRPSWQGRFNNGLAKQMKGKRKQKKSNADKPITRYQAETFKSMYKFPSLVSISIAAPIKVMNPMTMAAPVNMPSCLSSNSTKLSLLSIMKLFSSVLLTLRIDLKIPSPSPMAASINLTSATLTPIEYDEFGLVLKKRRAEL